MWRDHTLMLRLQRGEPVVYVNSGNAREKAIADHDLVRVWNDVGSFTARAKLTGAIHPGKVPMFHAWEPSQFRDGRSHQSLAPSPIKVTQPVGDYGHLHWGFDRYEPGPEKAGASIAALVEASVFSVDRQEAKFVEFSMGNRTFA